MWLRLKNLAHPTVTILGSSNYGACALAGGWCEDANAPTLTVRASRAGKARAQAIGRWRATWRRRS